MGRERGGWAEEENQPGTAAVLAVARFQLQAGGTGERGGLQLYTGHWAGGTGWLTYASATTPPPTPIADAEEEREELVQIVHCSTSL